MSMADAVACKVWRIYVGQDDPRSLSSGTEGASGRFAVEGLAKRFFAESKPGTWARMTRRDGKEVLVQFTATGIEMLVDEELKEMCRSL